MPTLEPPRKASAPASEPSRGPGKFLAWGLAVAVLAAVVAFFLWNRLETLETRLTDAERRAAQAGEQLVQARSETEAARAAASAASRQAEQEGTARQQAELTREFARERAERAELDSERAAIEAERSRAEAERLREARDRELNRMQQALSRIADTSRTPLGMVVNLGEDHFLFDFDKATLRPENRELLSRIAGVLLASHGYRLYVYGHTDDIGDANYNQDLSERRANSVRDYLVAAGIPDEIIKAKGFGKTSPRVKGSSREARRQNRRVEIGVVDTVVNYETVVPESGQ